MVKKAFHTPVLLDLKGSECKENGTKNTTVDEEKNEITNKSEKLQKINVKEKSLTDEEYEEIFEAVLHSGAARELSGDSHNEDKENDAPHNEDHIQHEEINGLNPSLPAQEANEFTPVCSDEEGDKSISSLPPPPKKKKTFTTKRTLPPKQLNYQHNKHSSCSDSGNLKKRKNSARETTRDRLLALHHSRLEENTGTWVQCCNPECCKWRCLKEIKEPSSVPKEWFCSMNEDPERNSCDKPEEDYQQYEFVYTKFVPGSVVWAKVDGYPWWPAMVEDDPDTEEFVWTSQVSEFPTFYHVVFFDDKVSRAWVRKCYVKSFTGNESGMPYKGKDYAEMIEVAYNKALKALKMTLEERLKTYSFGCRYQGKWPKAWEGFDGKEIMLSKKKLEKKNKKSILKNYTDNGTLYTKDKFLIEAESILEELSDISSFSSLDIDFLEDESLADSNHSCQTNKRQQSNQEVKKQPKKSEKKVEQYEKKNASHGTNCSDLQSKVVTKKCTINTVGKGNAGHHLSLKEVKNEKSNEADNKLELTSLKKGLKSKIKNKNLFKQQAANQASKVGTDKNIPSSKLENYNKQIQIKSKVKHSTLPKHSKSHFSGIQKNNLKSKSSIMASFSDEGHQKQSSPRSNSTAESGKKDKEASVVKPIQNAKKRKNFMPPIPTSKKNKEAASLPKPNSKCTHKEKKSTLLSDSAHNSAMYKADNSRINKKGLNVKHQQNDGLNEDCTEMVDALDCSFHISDTCIDSEVFDLSEISDCKEELESVGSNPFDMDDT